MGTLYLYCSLPPVEMGSKPSSSSKELYASMQMNLRTPGLNRAKTLRLWIDLQNIYASYFKETKFDSRGMCSKSLLDELIASEEVLPDYLFDFFSEYKEFEDRKRNFPKVLSMYFQIEKEKARGYLKQFLEFEHSWRVVIAGYRAKKLRQDVTEELKFEDFDDETVRMVLAQSASSGKFIFPYELMQLGEKLDSVLGNPKQEQYVLSKHRFKFYENYYLTHQFTEAGVMAYMMMLWILEDYFALSTGDGLQMLDEMVENRNAS